MRDHQVLFEGIYRKEKWGIGKGSGIGSQPSMAAKYLDYLRTIPRGASVIDMGCGDHQLYVGLDLSQWDYTGVDISRLALDLAKERSPAAKLILISSPTEWLPLALGKDVCLVKDVIMHWTDEELEEYFVPFCAGYKGRIILSHNHKFVRGKGNTVQRTAEMVKRGDSWAPISIEHPIIKKLDFKPVGYWGTQNSRVILER